jgi:rhodanese-related sulfurtransferase
MVIPGYEPAAPVPRSAPHLDDVLAAVRATYRRVDPAEAAAVHARGGLLVDIRPAAQRAREGGFPGAVVIERNVLEWRLAPSSDHRIPEVAGADHEVVVACSEGYASSFAAAALRLLGLRNATDLIGGFQAWSAAGLPVIPPADT